MDGHRIVELEGPSRITPDELAAALGQALGREVTPQVVPRETWETLFRAQGMQNPMPRMRMVDGFNEGWIESSVARLRKRARARRRCRPCCAGSSPAALLESITHPQDSPCRASHHRIIGWTRQMAARLLLAQGHPSCCMRAAHRGPREAVAATPGAEAGGHRPICPASKRPRRSRTSECAGPIRCRDPQRGRRLSRARNASRRSMACPHVFRDQCAGALPSSPR